MRTRRQMPGFTLVELAIVMALIGILAAVLAPVALTSFTAYLEVRNDVEVLDRLRYATERLAREIREVNYDTASGFAFTCMGSNNMSFVRTYLDGTSGAESANTTVTVGNTGSAVTLQYSSGGGAQTLTNKLNGTAALSFSYLDNNGAPITAPNPCTNVTAERVNVRSVVINLTLTHNGNTYPQTTQVQLKRYSGS